MYPANSKSGHALARTDRKMSNNKRFDMAGLLKIQYTRMYPSHNRKAFLQLVVKRKKMGAVLCTAPI